jgi:hypothetical protein
VNAVNLLPAKHRPRTPTGGQQGSSYVVIGVLGGLLLMVLMYALTANGVNSKKASVQRTKAETVVANKRAAELAPYGSFVQVKEQRVASVKGLATGRIDWERLARGLGHVLPDDVWLVTATATATGNGDGSSGASAPAAPPAATPPPPAPGGGGAAPTPPAASSEPSAPTTQPTMVLTGCASNHSLIATTLVRLRHLPAVADVELTKATKPVDVNAENGGTPAAAAGGSGECGSVKKKALLTFEVSVKFKPQAGSQLQPGAEKDNVPTALGGGA